MSLRSACAAVAAAAVLVAVPACKKKSPPTEGDPAAPAATPQPGGGPQTGPNPVAGANAAVDPNAPSTPVFGLTDPRTAAMRAAAEQDLKQISLALHNYHDVMNGFPTAIVDKTGKPLLSWRVALLPYLDQDNLYKQFKLDEPWDSPHNKALVTQMPKRYAPPKTDTFGYTFYRGFSGPGTWLPPAVGPRPRAIRLTDFSDGASNTILVAEAAAAVIWTKPDEMEFVKGKPPAVGGVFASGTHVLFADGRVQLLRKSLDPTTLAKLIQIADGEIVNLD